MGERKKGEGRKRGNTGRKERKIRGKGNAMLRHLRGSRREQEPQNSELGMEEGRGKQEGGARLGSGLYPRAKETSDEFREGRV